MSKKSTGRPQLPPERKKKRYSVVLIPDDADRLIKRFGSLTLAIRAHLISEPTEKQALDTLKQINQLTNKALRQ